MSKAKTTWVVRVVTHPTEMDTESTAEHAPNHTLGEFMECLRYAHLIRIHHQDSTGLCFDLLPPQGVDSMTWADLNTKRMQSFGYNACRAPAYP